jgi:hypothetical protein
MTRAIFLRVLTQALLLVAIVAPAAHAGVYKCASENGSVVYQDQACGPGRELRDLERDPPQLSIVPGTPVPPPTLSKRAAVEKPPRLRTVAVKSHGGDPAERKFLRMGMTEIEVLHRIGRPDTKTGARRGEGTQWSYLPTAGDPDTITTVTFAGGAVSRVERKVVR